MSLLRAIRHNPQVLCRNIIARSLSSQTDGEVRIAQVLKEKFPQATALKVVDISGGCGAMYEIHIESDEFKGKRTVQQHQLVNQALKDEIKAMHGLRIFTDVPRK
ncbi:bolA-like protein 3 [Danio rerio]|uniref:BolA-like protein 3 n=1 Tax=Danio rerio TaxID=7955 RepID=Q6DC87_DANRE|nr:bolA-like protein 3 [Danio rerio]AAH78189.1 Zgc:100870 protein [Danio rerio]|eukprot:NP_001003525.1 bolA-like protein 3 [Danio rerio]